MKLTHLFFGILITIGLFNCTPYYVSNNFNVTTLDHQTVAVLPFEMVYTGQRPEELTHDDINEIAIAESQAFQISYYNEILRSTKSGRKPIRVDLQDYRKTMNLLNENNIDVISSWDEQSEELAEILGVDALVRARVEKKRLMTDLESYGIEVAVHILDAISPHTVWPWLPHDLTKAKEIKTSYSLVDHENGQLLWSISIDIDADWRLKSNEIIDDINRRSAKKFPYRL